MTNEMAMMRFSAQNRLSWAVVVFLANILQCFCVSSASLKSCWRKEESVANQEDKLDLSTSILLQLAGFRCLCGISGDTGPRSA
ncbi:hypothetical protein QBC32DRAFT_351543 [Pseudoneurospora amorphoporcata]|uniref:Uncharacterized protein n=1 Tax=Pseudoneurospora amorphoporcata TaxID=241081 RepID=A0AAN6NMS8_9PEZI|nr:hypothetical protein QBC32DRAFT_351543 [Pseudoneurospora amorphoporcata]